MNQAVPHQSQLWQPREPGTRRAILFSLGAHLLLAIFLSIGLSWKNSTPTGVEAELWDSVPEQPTVQEIAQPVLPAPVARAEPTPVDHKAEIATKKEKKHEKPEKTPKPEPKHQIVERRPEPKPVKEKVKEKEKPKEVPKVPPKVVPKEVPKETQKVVPKETAKEKAVPKESTNKGSSANQSSGSTSTAAQDKERADRLSKLRAAAGAESGSGGTVGTGVGSGGTASAGYTDKVRRKIKPFIVFNTASVSGNPAVSVNVELAPDGTIINKQIMKSSGSDDWDGAVMRALDRATSLPKDDDGKAPRQITLIFKPKD